VKKLQLGFLAAAMVFVWSGSSATLAQSRRLTDQERLQMQKELAWEKQQKLKADQNARTTYTERCSMTGGRLNCQGSQPANPQQAKPVVQSRTGTIVPTGNDQKLGTAYGTLQKNNPQAGQPGYHVNNYINAAPRQTNPQPATTNFGIKYYSR